MAPRVLLDATAVPADRAGVGRYVDGLIGAFRQLRADGQPVEVAIVCQRSDAERYRRCLPGAEILPGPAAIAHRPARLAWEQTGLPVVAENLGADVIHSPHYTMPLHAPVPVVVTVHDATWISDPDLHSSVRGGFYRSAIRTSLRRAARVVVPSESTRQELVRLVQADPDRLVVARHGVDTTTFRPPSDADKRRVAARLGLAGLPYVAFLGELGRRKNVPGLVRGWVSAVGADPQPPALVLAGGTGWDDDLAAALDEVPDHLRIVQPGFLRMADLAGLLGGALVVAYPSGAEGFGLPVLEAMACGAPVLAARRRSLPEVGGDAVEYAEPDPAGIAAGLRRLLDDPARRQALAAAGPRRAAGFPWTASAQAHVVAYTSAANPTAVPA